MILRSMKKHLVLNLKNLNHNDGIFHPKIQIGKNLDFFP
jgi:hypothetical protein